MISRCGPKLLFWHNVDGLRSIFAFVMFIYIGLILATSLILGAEGSVRKRPHIIFILADDLGWNDVSFHGSLQIPTPNIDVLASNGIILNNYYVQHMCSPSRAALLTGRHPIHLGMQHHVLIPSQNAGLPLNVRLLPEYLRKLGYATHAVGKWHLGFHKKEFTPTYRGFDSFFGTWLPYMDYYDHTYISLSDLNRKMLFWGRALRDNMEPTTKYMGKYITHLLTNKAVSIIKNHNSSQPLFLYIPHVAVHTGNVYKHFQSPMREILAMGHIKDADRQVFAGMVAALDKSVGKIFRALDRKGMLEDSVFIFSSDNGADAPVSGSEKGSKGSNWPLRGKKATLWEGGIRGVAFIWSRLLKETRRISNQLMHITDWLTTLYHVAGGNVDDLGDVYGINLWDSLSYNLPSQREEILHNIDPVDKASALRMGKYKIVLGSNAGGRNNGWYGPIAKDNEISYQKYINMLQKSTAWKVLEKHGWLGEITDKWRSQLEIRCENITPQKDTVCEPDLSPCLFNIERDPCERNNIAHRHPEILKAMLDRLQEYNATAVNFMGLNLTSDPRANPLLHSFLWTNWAQEL